MPNINSVSSNCPSHIPKSKALKMSDPKTPQCHIYANCDKYAPGGRANSDGPLRRADISVVDIFA